MMQYKALIGPVDRWIKFAKTLLSGVLTRVSNSVVVTLLILFDALTVLMLSDDTI